MSRRLLVMLAAWLAIAGLSRAVALLAQAVMVAALQAGETPMNAIRAWASLIGWAVFVGFLVRFAFVPFLVALDGGRDHASAETPSRAARSEIGTLPRAGIVELVRRRLYRFAWPLFESNRMTVEIRGRLVPYLALGLFAPAAVAVAPSPLRPIVSFGLHLLSFTALAVVFQFYVDRTRSEA